MARGDRLLRRENRDSSRRLRDHVTVAQCGQFDRVRGVNAAQLARRSSVQRLLRLGPRSIVEFLEELASHGAVDEAVLERGLAVDTPLDPGILAAVEANNFARNGPKPTAKSSAKPSPATKETVTPSLPHSVARRAGTVPTAPCSAHDDRPAGIAGRPCFPCRTNTHLTTQHGLKGTTSDANGLGDLKRPTVEPVRAKAPRY
jgi:hypothetical protein